MYANYQLIMNEIIVSLLLNSILPPLQRVSADQIGYCGVLKIALIKRNMNVVSLQHKSRLPIFKKCIIHLEKNILMLITGKRGDFKQGIV